MNKQATTNLSPHVTVSTPTKPETEKPTENNKTNLGKRMKSGSEPEGNSDQRCRN